MSRKTKRAHPFSDDPNKTDPGFSAEPWNPKSEVPFWNINHPLLKTCIIIAIMVALPIIIANIN